jgi:hypothetical protein
MWRETMNRVIVENQCLTELKQVSSDKLEEVLSFLRDLNQNTHFAQNNQNTSSDSVDALKMLLDMSQPMNFTDLAENFDKYTGNRQAGFRALMLETV